MGYYKADRKEMTNLSELGDKKVVVVAESEYDQASNVETLLDGQIINETQYDELFIAPLEGEEKDLHYLLVYDNQEGKLFSRLYKVVS